MQYDQYGRPIEQPMQGEQGAPSDPQAQTGWTGSMQQAERAQELQPVSEMSVETPTLRWVTLESFEDQVPIGPDDHVLDSFYNPQVGAWEVLVIVQPAEEEED